MVDVASPPFAEDKTAGSPSVIAVILDQLGITDPSCVRNLFEANAPLSQSGEDAAPGRIHPGTPIELSLVAIRCSHASASQILRY
jgi:hypothetical protein